MGQVIDFNNKKYMIDLKRLFDFISGNPEKKLNYETAITQSYGYPTTMSAEELGSSEMQLISKETTESKSSLNDVMINIRYDFVKQLLGIVTDGQQIDWKFEMAFNTLFNEKIIIEINDKNDE